MKKKQKFNVWVSNSKRNIIFYKVELVIRKKNFYKNFWIGNFKCEFILYNSIS